MRFNYLKRAFSGWQIQKNVIKALMYRELKTKISKARFGLLGVLIEPFLTLVIFIIIFSVFRIRPTNGLNIYLFLGIGFMYYRTFQGSIISSLNSLNANRALFTYKQVKPIDTVITRCIVEAYINFIILIVLFLVNFLIEGYLLIDSFPMFILSFAALNIFCLSLGIITMVACYRYEWLKISIPFILRPLFFTSGVLFSIRIIPQDLHPLLTWNPILHAIEVARNSINYEYILVDNISIMYVLNISFITLTLALFIYLKNITLFYGK